MHAGLPRAERQRRPRQRGRWIATRVLTSTVVAQASAVDHAESSAQAELRGKRYPHWSAQPDTPISSLLSLNRPKPFVRNTCAYTQERTGYVIARAPEYVHTSHTARSIPCARVAAKPRHCDRSSLVQYPYLALSRGVLVRQQKPKRRPSKSAPLPRSWRRASRRHSNRWHRRVPGRPTTATCSGCSKSGFAWQRCSLGFGGSDLSSSVQRSRDLRTRSI